MVMSTVNYFEYIQQQINAIIDKMTNKYDEHYKFPKGTIKSIIETYKVRVISKLQNDTPLYGFSYNDIQTITEMSLPINGNKIENNFIMLLLPNAINMTNSSQMIRTSGWIKIKNKIMFVSQHKHESNSSIYKYSIADYGDRENMLKCIMRNMIDPLFGKNRMMSLFHFRKNYIAMFQKNKKNKTLMKQYFCILLSQHKIQNQLPQYEQFLIQSLLKVQNEKDLEKLPNEMDKLSKNKIEEYGEIFDQFLYQIMFLTKHQIVPLIDRDLSKEPCITNKIADFFTYGDTCSYRLLKFLSLCAKTNRTHFRDFIFYPMNTYNFIGWNEMEKWICHVLS